ncbi:MAG: sn-glycerol-1-phosphate dehydrogenase, partial [Planctomycetota bacterium]
MTAPSQTENQLLTAALHSARDTELLLLDRSARFQAGDAFAKLFGSAEAIVIADENTFQAAGRDVHDALRRAAQATCDPLVLPAAGLYAEYSFVEQVLG